MKGFFLIYLITIFTGCADFKRSNVVNESSVTRHTTPIINQDISNNEKEIAPSIVDSPKYESVNLSLITKNEKFSVARWGRSKKRKEIKCEGVLP